MCGIAGVYSDDAPVAADMLARMNAAQRHRGPDGSSHWIAARRSVGLGHTRLAVIGLDNGTQPICNEDESVFVVVNGEFYDYESIRSTLIERGHRFRTDSDSEIAVHLYEEHGIGFLERLRGEFAMLLWDERRQVLHAVRDRFGIKPLFYTQSDGRILFASEMKALLEAGKQARWDRESFWNYLYFSVLPDRTWFEGIKQVPPGHVLTVSARGVSVTRYWDLCYPRDASEYASDEDAFGVEFEQVFHDSVRLRTKADVTVGAQLSGGTDSTTIVAAASRYTSDLRTFTVRFSDSAYDEWDAVAQTSRELGLQAAAVEYDDSSLFELLKPAGFHAEWIQENSHGIARFLLSKAIHDSGLKVVLAGEGGDELFGGYAHFQQDLTHTMTAASQSSAASSGSVTGRISLSNPFRGWLRRVGYVPAWMTQRYHAITQWMLPLLTDEFAAEVRARDPFESFLDHGMAQRLQPLTPFHQSLYVFNKTRLPNYILVGERLDMAHAVEVRLPYLDHHLFDCVRRMPLAMYRKGGQEKYMLRRALQRLMRTEHIGAKRPFLAPPRLKAGGGQSYRYFLEQVLASQTMRDQPFFSARKLQDALRDSRARMPRDSESAEAVWQMIIGVWLIQAQFIAC
jgi:asparagine synthase (glutamine-hydrolysing)